MQCSGVLLYGRTGYLQLIEGPDSAIRMLRTAVFTNSAHVVDWSHCEEIEFRAIQRTLPMGYIDETEFMKDRAMSGPLMAWPGFEPCDMFAAFRMVLDLARRKYPTACRPPVLAPIPQIGIVHLQKQRA